MTITRRDLCILLPGLLPVAATLDAFAESDNSLPSANYPFDKLAVQALDHAEMRRVLKGKLATGEALEVTRRCCLPARLPMLCTVMCTPKCGSFGRAQSNSRSTAPATVWDQAEWDSFIRTTSMASRMSALLRPTTSSSRWGREQTPDASIGRDKTRICLVRLNLTISFYELTPCNSDFYSLRGWFGLEPMRILAASGINKFPRCFVRRRGQDALGTAGRACPERSRRDANVILTGAAILR